jgi:putative two-component system response regulator
MARRTLLLVDDSPMNIKVLAGMLREEYRIVIAKSGEQALEIIEKGDLPDLIFLDVVMPGIDGYEVCKRIKEDERTKSVPVIFMSAKSEQDEIQKGLSLGAEAFIPKPFDAGTVKKLVKAHLGP